LDSHRPPTTPEAPQGFAVTLGDAVDAKQLGQLLRDMREGQGLTLKQLEEVSGLLWQNLGRLERGARDGVLLGTMNRVVRALGFELVLTARPIGKARKRARKAP
jgi:transcriptional regulator with XRE-family HTH domain